MALFKIQRGVRDDLPQEYHDGWAYFCTDDFTFHIDYLDENNKLRRAQLNAKDADTITGASVSTVLASDDTDMEIPTSKAVLSALAQYQTKLEFDAAPTESSAKPVTSGGVKTYVDTAVVEHNLSEFAHSDIRQLVANVQTDTQAQFDNLESTLGNVVTVPGGGSISMAEMFGEGPYTIEFVDDESYQEGVDGTSLYDIVQSNKNAIDALENDVCQLSEEIGDIDAALDGIILLQNSYINGGEGA